MQAVQHVCVDAFLCHPGDLIPYDTQHKHTDVHQHRRVDVHSEKSVRNNNNNYGKTQYKHLRKSASWEFFTRHAKRNQSISPF
jgi:hypothetical protein